MVDLFGKRFYFFGLSILIIIAGIVGYFVHGGFNLDIQFEGGAIVSLQMEDNKFDAGKAAEEVSKAINKKVSAQKSERVDPNGKGRIYMLVLNVAEKSQSLSSQEVSKVLDAVKDNFKVKKDTQPEIRNVSAFIGQELLRNAMMAAVIVCILIVLYLWFRFRTMSGPSAGVMGIVGLLHDAAVMISVYTIFNIPMNESFIAAILTILGYSMCDTIIIYDRIRENTKLLRKVPIAELVNKSILQTLGRSINTVLTVLISIATVYGFAVYYQIESVQEFTLPLLIGIASGCYSSIFIASPLWVMWKQYKAKQPTVSKA
ncbi:protein translocase subunit SecF [Pseudobacteroides cellulosolvens]|uniref:Protein-export membrane protein SecF n=1 Tax=Pseudobacteroides cellulosolvens ATCC 35603 = DSM 2933 TaxID=398512 RepID=A0A0L6JIC4_9FIRM|nr:protein translocase subunit SecF [Pseudobacteroides cellulosolvens]KNY25448.1 SecF protein [Pseudobacteroides cellulosolvens ATCC 35603 = DSM 2933]